MASRLDLSPQSRLRNLASSLRLSDDDVEEALAVTMGDCKAAEHFLRSLTGRARMRQSARFDQVLTREERINKCASHLASTPDALDLLHASLAKVIAQPHAERLRKVNVKSGVFHDRVAAKNGSGVELLYAVGYEPMHGHLVLQKHEPALLTIALNALSRARELPTYREAKAALEHAAAAKAAAAEVAASAAARRAVHAAKVPAEPGYLEAGRASSACVVSITIGGEQYTRRFDSDSTLATLVHFIRSLPALADPDGALALSNVTTRPARVLDALKEGEASLYSLDLWPRGKVLVQAVGA